MVHNGDNKGRREVLETVGNSQLGPSQQGLFTFLEKGFVHFGEVWLPMPEGHWSAEAVVPGKAGSGSPALPRGDGGGGCFLDGIIPTRPHMFSPTELPREGT